MATTAAKPDGIDPELWKLYNDAGQNPAGRGTGFADWQYWQGVGPSQYGRLAKDIAGTGTDQTTGTPWGAGAWQGSGAGAAPAKGPITAPTVARTQAPAVAALDPFSNQMLQSELGPYMQMLGTNDPTQVLQALRAAQQTRG